MTAGTTLRLTLLHTRYTFLETIRVPIAVIGSLVFPSLSFLFFVVPMRYVADDRVAATAATIGLAFFAVMANCLFTFGVGVADDREKPWDPYLRSLPVGPVPRMGARLFNGLLWSLLALVPLLALSAVATNASIDTGRFLLSAVLLSVGALPFLFGGLALGYLLSAKAALAIAQVAMFTLAFAGGLFLPPGLFPSWLDGASRVLPSRAGRDLLQWGALGGHLSVATVAGVLGWTALTLAAALWAYRRDEGQRFR